MAAPTRTIRATMVIEDGSSRAPEIPLNTAIEVRMVRGEDVDIELRAVTAAGADFPLNGTVTVNIGTRVDGTPLISKSATVTSGFTASITIPFSDWRDVPAGVYLWEVKLTQAGKTAVVVPFSRLVVAPNVAPF